MSCTQVNLNTKYCEALNAYIRENKIDSSFLIINKFIKLNAWIPKSEMYISDQDTIYLHEPPPLSSETEVLVSKESLALLARDEVIDSNDIDYLFNHLEEVSRIQCSPLDFKFKSISSEVFAKYKIYRDGDEFFNRLENDFKVRSYIVFSQPLFTKNRETVIFYSNLYCGSLCGIGHRIAMKLVNGSWKTIYSKKTWIS